MKTTTSTIEELEASAAKAGQAIQTRVIPATNTRPTRFKAFCERGEITVPANDELGHAACHVAAAETLCAKFIAEDEKEYGTPAGKNPWGRPFVSGGLNGGDFCHVFLPRELVGLVVKGVAK